MRISLFCCTATFVMLGCGSFAAAQSLLYSFEGGIDGFAGNGGGAMVASSTTGATNGTGSLEFSVIQPATFVGALTSTIPAALNDPPKVQSILFDLTIEERFTGGFANLGITVFGASQPDYPGGQQFGLQAQFADFEPIGGLAPGTYTDLEIDLGSATHPLTFATGSFNDIFGGFGTGVDDMIPTGFQFYLNKSNDAPIAIYIDNVRAVVPEPGSLSLVALAAVGLAVAMRHRSRS
jgi:hypothetical protein